MQRRLQPREFRPPDSQLHGGSSILQSSGVYSSDGSGESILPVKYSRPQRLPLFLPLLAAMLLLQPVGRAQLAAGPLQAASTESVGKGVPVRGVVTNSLTGQGVPRALVVLNQDFAVLTGADGQFSFDNVPTGGYSVSVRRPRYLGFGTAGGMQGGMRASGSFQSGTGPAKEIQVTAEMASLRFALTPLGIIGGTVTLSTADMPDSIEILLYRHSLENGRGRWMMAGQVHTHSDGTFRLADLPPGEYMIFTQPMPEHWSLFAEGDKTPVWGYPAVYYPGASDISGAGVIHLGAGQQVEADLTLIRRRFYPVTAVVDGMERGGSFTIVDSAGRTSRLPVQYDATTRTVHALVPNGRWSIEARGFGNDAQWGRASFQVADAPVRLALATMPVPKIPVEIRRDFTASASSAESGVPGMHRGGALQSSGDPGLSLNLQSADDFTEGGYANLRAANGAGADGSGANGPGPDGPWELEIFQPGRYWVEAAAYSPGYVSSITSGGVDLANQPLEVVEGSTPPPIDVTLRNDSGTISGQVNGLATAPTPSPQGPASFPHVWIYAIPLFPNVAPLPSVMPNPSGQFAFQDVSPGSYRVVACDTPQEIDFHSPEGLAVWAGKGQTVTVDAGGTASASLEIMHMELEP